MPTDPKSKVQNVVDLSLAPSTLETIDQALFDYVDKTLDIYCDTNEGFAKVPVALAPQERAFQIKDNPELYKEMIAETKPKEVTVTRERDYSQKRKTYPNPFKGMSTYSGLVLSPAARDRDSLEAKTITNIFKQANDKEGFTAYLDKYGYKLRKGKPKKPTTSESIGKYKYTINK